VWPLWQVLLEQYFKLGMSTARAGGVGDGDSVRHLVGTMIDPFSFFVGAWAGITILLIVFMGIAW
jgi:hypothetical protein